VTVESGLHTVQVVGHVVGEIAVLTVMDLVSVTVVVGRLNNVLVLVVLNVVVVEQLLGRPYPAWALARPSAEIPKARMARRV
jgi:hypothetical protein